MGDMTVFLVLLGLAFVVGGVVGALLMWQLNARLIQAQEQLIATLKRDLARLNRSNGH